MVQSQHGQGRAQFPGCYLGDSAKPQVQPGSFGFHWPTPSFIVSWPLRGDGDEYTILSLESEWKPTTDTTISKPYLSCGRIVSQVELDITPTINIHSTDTKESESFFRQHTISSPPYPHIALNGSPRLSLSSAKCLHNALHYL